MSPTSVSREPFGSLEDGSPVHRFTLANDSLTASILDYGVRLQSLLCRLQGDEVRQCTLGFDKFETYLTDGAYIGAVVGRFANRIRDGRVTVDGSTCQLDRNEGDNHLHGGLKAFHNQKWQSAAIDDGVVFSLTSADGEGGYPGRLTISVTVRLEGDVLEYRYEAQSDRTTPLNVTNHAFFNLAGGGEVLDHSLQVAASRFVEADDSLLPTGRLLPVDHTMFDFREARLIGAGFDAPEVVRSDGYDLCYVLDGAPVAARLVAPDGKLSLTVSTDQPGLQFYTGNFLPAKHTGLCLETQHFPDSPNIPAFPSTLLGAGERFTSVTRYQFAALP